jgi:YHS domain-containing protein
METAMTRKSGSVVDPVCGMAVDPNAAAGTASFKGQAYWFCSTACLTAFRADPAEIPPSEAHCAEAEDYVLYFCGLDCYREWAAKAGEREDAPRKSGG